MRSVELDLKREIERVFGVQEKAISEFKNLGGSNQVYSFIVENQKYVVKKLNNSTIFNWENERDAYNSLKQLNITDELVYYDNGIKIAKFIGNSKPLTYCESDMIDTLDGIRMVHESGISIKNNYDIVENMEKYISPCDNNSKDLKELRNYRGKIEIIQTIVNELNIPPVLCHGDACATGNFLRLPDGSIRIIDWEQADMADPLLDIAIATLHQGFENVDPVWCLHHYLKRIPDEQEYLRLFSFLALDSYALMAWCVSDENPEGYRYFLDSAIKYSELLLRYYRKKN